MSEALLAWSPLALMVVALVIKPPAFDRHLKWLGPLAIVVTAAVMLHWSWGKWPDVLVDFGRELYMPWQLAQGQRLYADIADFNGPLSPYLNALWFALFGASLRTLVWCNILLVGVLVWLLYRLLTALSDRGAATVACLAFLLLCAFGQLVWRGNYNFLCPYSHELTHGIILSIAGLVCLERYLRRRDLASVAGMGLALGLALLTKPEIVLAAAPALTVGLTVALWCERAPRRRVRRVVVTFLIASVAPLVAALALLSLQMPVAEALRGTGSAWSWLLNRRIASLPYYRWGLGIADIRFSLWAIFLWSIRYVLYLGAAAWLALRLRRRGDRLHRWSAVGVLLLCYAWLQWQWRAVGWNGATFDVWRPLSLMVPGLVVVTGATLWRERARAAMARPVILRLAATLFAGLLLAKMALNARVYHYGFALGMPAMLLAILLCVAWIPMAITQRGGAGDVVRAAALAALLVIVHVHLRVTDFLWAQKTYRVGSGADAFWADARGSLVQRTIQDLAQRLPPDATLAAVPEGCIVNYLTRHRNPTPYLYLMWPEMLHLRESPVIASFLAHPPDYILLVSRETDAYGHPFGLDYGQMLYRWIQDRYQSVYRIGAPPFQQQGIGLLLMRRRQQGGSV